MAEKNKNDDNVMFAGSCSKQAGSFTSGNNDFLAGVSL